MTACGEKEDDSKPSAVRAETSQIDVERPEDLETTAKEEGFDAELSLEDVERPEETDEVLLEVTTEEDETPEFKSSQPWKNFPVITLADTLVEINTEKTISNLDEFLSYVPGDEVEPNEFYVYAEEGDIFFLYFSEFEMAPDAYDNVAQAVRHALDLDDITSFGLLNTLKLEDWKDIFLNYGGLEEDWETLNLQFNDKCFARSSYGMEEYYYYLKILPVKEVLSGGDWTVYNIIINTTGDGNYDRRPHTTIDGAVWESLIPPITERWGLKEIDLWDILIDWTNYDSFRGSERNKPYKKEYHLTDPFDDDFQKIETAGGVEWGVGSE